MKKITLILMIILVVFVRLHGSFPEIQGFYTDVRISGEISASSSIYAAGISFGLSFTEWKCHQRNSNRNNARRGQISTS